MPIVVAMKLVIQVPNHTYTIFSCLFLEIVRLRLGQGLDGTTDVVYCCIPQPQGPETHYHNVV